MHSSTDVNAMAALSHNLDDLGDLFGLGDIDLNNFHEMDSQSFVNESRREKRQKPAQSTELPPSFQELSDEQMFAEDAAPGHTGMPMGVGPGDQHYPSQQQPDQAFVLGQQPAMGVPHGNLYAADAMYGVSSTGSYCPSTFQFAPSHPFPPAHHMPPTPNSHEMHGQHGAFASQHLTPLDLQHQPLMNAQQQQSLGLQKALMTSFTPMVSPAVTPQFGMLDVMSTPGAYFSPLSSPMLVGQPDLMHRQQQHQMAVWTHPSTAPSSSEASPNDVEPDVSLRGDGTRSAVEETAGRTSRKAMTPRTRAMAAVKTTTAGQKAQKRKLVIDTFTERPIHCGVTSQPSSADFPVPSVFGSPEASSASPEAPGDSVMGPPPRPGSNTHSPAMWGQVKGRGGSASGPAATPKSLLQGRKTHPVPSGGGSKPRRHNSPLGNEFDSLDDLSLPAAATDEGASRSLAQVGGSSHDVDEKAVARKTPKLGPSSALSSARPSAMASPSILASPTAARTPGGSAKVKKDRKRGPSTCGTPKVLPRSSPSIKPLLPEGSPLHSATQALLLASKSNYQNIVEGNHLPGLSYPASLSSGLTSKRTSHKVAEQGRRNRINDALREMQSLLSPARSGCIPVLPSSAPAASPDAPAAADPVAKNPFSSSSSSSSSTSSKDAAPAPAPDKDAKNASSKAATVELANEYIRQMQRDNATKDEEVGRLRAELEALRARLRAASPPASEAGSPAAGAQSITATDTATAMGGMGAAETET